MQMAHFMVNMHKSHRAWLCNVNEFLKNGLKWVVLAKKSLQNPLIYYKMIKRGMTYDDVGGYQSQYPQGFAVNFHGECPNLRTRAAASQYLW